MCAVAAALSDPKSDQISVSSGRLLLRSVLDGSASDRPWAAAAAAAPDSRAYLAPNKRLRKEPMAWSYEKTTPSSYGVTITQPPTDRGPAAQTQFPGFGLPPAAGGLEQKLSSLLTVTRRQALSNDKANTVTPVRCPPAPPARKGSDGDRTTGFLGIQAGIWLDAIRSECDRQELTLPTFFRRSLSLGCWENHFLCCCCCCCCRRRCPTGASLGSSNPDAAHKDPKACSG